jgi:hypothetical protein
MATPKRKAGRRQPKGSMPKAAMPAEMMIFPRGGWVHS